MLRSLALILFLASLLLLCPNSVQAQTPVTYVQACGAQGALASSPTSCILPAVAANSIIVATTGFAWSTSSGNIVTLSGGGLTWNLVDVIYPYCNAPGDSHSLVGMWYAQTTSLASVTVTWTYTNSPVSNNPAFYAAEYSGADTTTPLLAVLNHTVSSSCSGDLLTNPISTGATTVTNGDMLIGTGKSNAIRTITGSGCVQAGTPTALFDGRCPISTSSTRSIQVNLNSNPATWGIIGAVLRCQGCDAVVINPPPPPTGQFIRGVWWVNQSGGDTGGSGSGNFDNLNIDTGSPLPTGVVGQAYSTTLAASGGVKPYAWSEVNGSLPDGLAIGSATGVISGTPTVATTDATAPSGYEDLMQWMILDSRRLSQHYSSGSWHYLFGDTGATSGAGPKFAWIKNGAGNPWDIDRYGANSIDFWITENGDSSEDATCIGNGYISCAADPYAYKRFVVPVPVAPRFFKLGTTITLTSDAPNLIQRTTNCELDSEPTFDLGHIKGVTTGPQTIAWGGTVGTQPTVIVNYYWGGSGSTYSTREREFLVKNFGRVQWDTAHWTGTGYAVDATSTHNTLTAGGSPDPNFPCGYSQIWWPGPDASLSTTIKVTDAHSSFTSKLFALPIIDAPVQDLAISTTSPLPVATQGQSYSQTFTAIGGTTPYTFSLTAGALPAGITRSGATISGIPTASGTFTFTIQVTDNVSATFLRAFTLTVNPVSVPKPPTITSTSPLPNAIQGSAYQVTLKATGGTPPYTWNHISGTLPAGLTLASDGTLSGTPTANGTFSFTAQVTDSVSLTASKSFSLTVNFVAHSVELHWNASSGATSYNVYRSTVSGGCAVVTSSTCIKIGTGITQLQWTDANVQ